MGRALPRQLDDDPSDLSDRALDAARFGLWRAQPERSARRILTTTQVATTIALTAIAIAAAILAPAATGAAAYLFCLAMFGLAAATKLAGTIWAATAPKHADEPSGAWTAPLPIYTIMCPLFKEPSVVPTLVAALRKLDYPRERLDIKLVLEADDAETIAAARVVASDMHIVLTPAAAPRTKPKALNYALAFAEGEFVAIFDAEDLPHPRQLRAALDAFAVGGPGLGVVQAPLVIDNGRASWIARQFEVEYALHFLGVVPLLSRLRLPIPLGGTSNHFRAAALRACGAWDPFNVTEDIDLGYRMAAFGWRSAAIAPPTFEEAPVRTGAWIKQRSRWIKGYAATWFVLARKPISAIRAMGVLPWLSTQIVLLGGVGASLAYAPTTALFLVMTIADPTTLTADADMVLFLTGYGSAVFGGAAAALARGRPRLALAGLTTPLYWMLSCAAAIWALAELTVRPHTWRKTEHGRSKRETPSQWEWAPRWLFSSRRSQASR